MSKQEEKKKEKKYHSFLPSQISYIINSNFLPALLCLLFPIRIPKDSGMLYPSGYSLSLFLNHFVLKDYITLGGKKKT